jgi:diguanylate cyclase (GGDEF)-like protein
MIQPINLPLAAGVGALVLAALFLLLYVYRRRNYILEWTVGWLLIAAALLILAREVASPRIAHVLVGFALFLLISAGLCFVLSVDNFRQKPRLQRRHVLVLLPLVIWFTLAPLALGPWSALVPGHLTVAVVLVAAGVGYLRLLGRSRLLGAGILGATFLMLAVLHAWLSLAFAGLSASTPLQLLWVMAPLYVAAGFGIFLLVFEDMTYELRRTNRRLEAAQGELRHLVITDVLTGCYNRRFFDEIIGREIQRHRRYGTPLSVLFLDVDRFKAVNDSLGHETGDRLLQHVAGFLQRHIREADYVFRWGGDEFLVLLTCTEEDAYKKGRELQARFAGTPAPVALPTGVGLSIGCAELPEDGEDAMEVVRLADERMYRDKTR